MANNGVAEQVVRAISGFGKGVKVGSRKKTLTDLMKQGYISFQKKSSADLFIEQNKDQGYIYKYVDGECRVYPSDEEITGLKNFFNDGSLAYMCGLVKIFKDFTPLSITFTRNNDDTLSYTLVSNNIEDNTIMILETGTVPYSTELEIKALPQLLIYLKMINQTSIVLENEESFKLSDAPDKDRSYVVFRGLSPEEQKSIYRMNNFVNQFVSGAKPQEDKLFDVVFTGEKQTQEKAEADEQDKKEADIIINGYMQKASQINGPLYVSVVKDSSGVGKYKLGYFDVANKKIVSLTEKSINFYGEFRKRVLPFLYRELEARGKVNKIASYGKFNEQMVIDSDNFGQSSVFLLSGFGKEEIEYINNILSTPKENEEVKTELPKEFFYKYADYNKMIMDKINKQGYLKLTNSEFIEFSSKANLNDWDSTLKGDDIYIYPSIKTLVYADKNINASIYAAIRHAIEENNGTVSVIVDRLKDGSCKVEVNSYDKKTNTVVNLTTVRLMFEGEFVHNMVPFLSNALPILGPVSYKEFNILNLTSELPVGMLRDKSVVMFRGLTPEMSRQLHEVVQFGDKVNFGSITR